MSQLKTGYEWAPEELETWRRWADSLPDSVSRNKIHVLLNVYTDVQETDKKCAAAQKSAEDALATFEELLIPMIRAGLRKNATPESKEKAEDKIKEVIQLLSEIEEMKFEPKQVPTVLALERKSA